MLSLKMFANLFVSFIYKVAILLFFFIDWQLAVSWR